jgi:hypothetical protein
VIPCASVVLSDLEPRKFHPGAVSVINVRKYRIHEITSWMRYFRTFITLTAPGWNFLGSRSLSTTEAQGLQSNPGIRASSIDARGVVGYCASLASLAVTSAILEGLHKDPEVLPFLREQSTALEIDIYPGTIFKNGAGHCQGSQ